MRRRDSGIVRDGGAPTTAPAPEAGSVTVGAWRWPRHGCNTHTRRARRPKSRSCQRYVREAPRARLVTARGPASGLTMPGLQVRTGPAAVEVLQAARNRRPPGSSRSKPQTPSARSAGFIRRSRVHFRFGKPRCREAPRCAGPLDPAFRAPSDFPRGPANPDDGRPGPQRTGAMRACAYDVARYPPRGRWRAKSIRCGPANGKLTPPGARQSSQRSPRSGDG